jgi:predicted nucleic acid-binding protein
MEQPNFIIDTNIVIDYLGKKIPASGMNFMNSIINAIPNISVVTKIEVLGFNAPDEHYQLLTNFMDDANILNLTNSIVNTCIELRKNKKIKLPDAVIAATAIVYNLTLITRNTSDFKNINGLNCINPYEVP